MTNTEVGVIALLILIVIGSLGAAVYAGERETEECERRGGHMETTSTVGFVGGKVAYLTSSTCVGGR